MNFTIQKAMFPSPNMVTSNVYFHEDYKDAVGTISLLKTGGYVVSNHITKQYQHLVSEFACVQWLILSLKRHNKVVKTTNDKQLKIQLNDN